MSQHRPYQGKWWCLQWHSRGSCLIWVAGYRLVSGSEVNSKDILKVWMKGNIFQSVSLNQGPKNSGAEGAEAPPLFCSNNVSNKRSERNVKKKKIKKWMWRKRRSKNEMKGMRGRENDKNIRDHHKGERDSASKAYNIDYNFKLVSIKTAHLWTTAEN